MASRRKTQKRDSAPQQSDSEYIGSLYRDFYGVVRKIPKGRVATYGQIAELAGRPGAARAVGAAMRGCPPELGLPWQRVVGKRGPNTGKVSIHDPVGAGIQRAILEKEGVQFSASAGISLAEFGWLPRDSPRPSGRRSSSAKGSSAAKRKRPSAANTKRSSAAKRKRASGGTTRKRKA